MTLSPKSRLVQAGLSIAVIAAVAGITLGVTTLLGVTFQGSGEAQQELGAEPKEGLLLTANRDRLAICVGAVNVGSAVEVEAESKVEAALVDVAKHPHWNASGLGVASPRVDAGCPAPPLATRPDVKITRWGGSVLVEPVPIVDEASYYRLFVFILPASELDRIFQGALPLVDEQAYKSGDQIIGVTAGLYLTPEQLRDPTSLTEAIQRAVGLWDPGY